MNIFIEIIGWVANVLFVAAFALASRGRISGDGKMFNALNLVGALLYGTYAFWKSAWPVFVLEIFWGGIAFAALWKIFRNLNTTERKSA